MKSWKIYLEAFLILQIIAMNIAFLKENEDVVIGWRENRTDVKAPGNEGCCHKSGKEFYDFSFGLDCFFEKDKGYKNDFQRIQEKNILEEFSQTGSCKYHTDNGCAIKKLRSPICISWICPDYLDYLAQEFNIDYSGRYYSNNSVKALLGIVYDKKVDVTQVEETISNLKRAIKRIKCEEMPKRETRIEI